MTTWRDVRPLLFIALGISAGLEVLAPIELALGLINVDRAVGMLFDGITVVAASTVLVGLALAWSWLRSLWIRRRIRRDLLGSLSGTPQLAAAEGRTSPVDAVGPTTTALPDSSTISDLDSYRGRR
ncbi:hypothetical protein ACWCW7_34520 [Nocardia tengchongensis]